MNTPDPEQDDPLKFLKLSPKEAENFLAGARHLFGADDDPVEEEAPSDFGDFVIKPRDAVKPDKPTLRGRLGG